LRSRILCVHNETSSLWAEFVNKNRCISVRLVSWRLKALNFNNFDNSQNFSLIFLCERGIPCQAVTSVLCLHYRPETVHCSKKDAYTSEITFLALHPWTYPSLRQNQNINIIPGTSIKYKTNFDYYPRNCSTPYSMEVSLYSLDKIIF